MKLYYNNDCYDLISWKTLYLSPLIWSAQEQVKFKINIPRDTLYSMNKKSIAFDMIEDQELNYFVCNINSISISSTFRNGNVIAVFDVFIKSKKLQDKSKLRDYLLNDLLN